MLLDNGVQTLLIVDKCVDPEYLEFLEFLAKPVENLPSAEIQLERKEAERAGQFKYMFSHDEDNNLILKKMYLLEVIFKIFCPEKKYYRFSS